MEGSTRAGSTQAGSTWILNDDMVQSHTAVLSETKIHEMLKHQITAKKPEKHERRQVALTVPRMFIKKRFLRSAGFFHTRSAC